ncbi:TVP38/TMEM64 family protein [Corynebacterium uterequi]|uniref:TVP38/TMEM64 family protein n=1 Tax=Corynebacterium uterequi TaxID=1072256 RepID=UPI001F2B009C|nr:TVP38/TMEM64 family protein [Corynebacterium uterequi]
MIERLRCLCRDGIAEVARWPLWKKGAAALVLAGFVVGLLTLDVPSMAQLRSWASSLGPWFPMAFLLAYIIITQFPMPRTLLSISAGILFGPWLGGAIAMIGVTVSAAISLVVVRGFLREWIEPRLTHPAVQKINAHLHRRGLIAVISLRMIAGVPFSIMNYASAITKVPVGVFTLGTLIGSLPGTLLIVFFGDTLATEPNPVIIAAMVVLAVVGITALGFDARRAMRV